MKNKLINPVYKKAYFVPEWGTEIITGMAFTITYVDFYEVKRAFFIEDGKEYPSIKNGKNVVYSVSEAHNLLQSERKDMREYYEKQVKEYTDKLKTLA